MADKKAKRERGQILTDSGWSKLDAALQAWEVLPGNKRTFERIGLEAQLDPGTVAKILKRREGADLSKIEQVFRAFRLSVDDQDHVPVLQEVARIADPNFVGREEAIADLNTLISRDAKVIVIQARGGVGKTTLARKYLQQEFETVLEFPIAKETKDIASIESLIEEKLRQLGEEPGREFLVSIDRLKRKLQSDRIGILIDNLEPALDSAGKFIEPHRRYVELLRVLADPSVRSLTLITSRERLNEYSISVQSYLLKELSLEAWKQFFTNRFTLLASKWREFRDADDSALAMLQNAYGGNAKAMDILCGAILTDYGESIAAYWQANQSDLLIERALEDLVVGQCDRLQQLDLDAYNLLCRMGCYRYQDMPTVPIEGLFCLLWDVPENRQRRVVRSLIERSLVDYEDAEFWLHPVIRGEVIGRLKTSDNWKSANRKAAKFWRESVQIICTNSDVLKVFEGYYHYILVLDFGQAGEILTEIRSVYTEEFTARFFRIMLRFGLSKQLITSVNLVLDNFKSEAHDFDSKYYVAKLYTVLGNPYRSQGEIHQAIDCHNKVLSFIDECRLFPFSEDLISDLQALKLNSLISLGMCKVELLELEEAFEILTHLDRHGFTLEDYQNEMSEYSYRHGSTENTVAVFLALLYSFLKDKSQASDFVDAVNGAMKNDDNSIARGHRLIVLGEAYSHLGESDKALSLYLEAIDHAELNYFPESTAKAISCLAEIYANKGDFKSAMENHLKAIEVFRNIGAKGDLAKACYRCGLTHQIMGDIDKSNENFQEAIRLFTEMEAPKQIERVRRSMNGKT